MLNTRLRFLLSVIFFIRAREEVLVTVKKMRGFAALHDARCAVARKAGGFKEFAGAAVSGGQPDLADLKATDVEDGEGVLYKSATNTAVLRFGRTHSEKISAQ